jgi:hypothetical protein
MAIGLFESICLVIAIVGSMFTSELSSSTKVISYALASGKDGFTLGNPALRFQVIRSLQSSHILNPLLRPECS